MDAVWISRLWRDTVWAALHNIRIRQNPSIKTPAVVFFGESTSAGINIDLPGTGNGESIAAYDGPFSVSLQTGGEGKQKKTSLMARGGLISVGSSRLEVEDLTFGEPSAGVVYAEVIYSDESEAYTHGVFFDRELPEDEDPKRWLIRLALVEPKPGAGREESAFKIRQIWTGGDLSVTGRWVK